MWLRFNQLSRFVVFIHDGFDQRAVRIVNAAGVLCAVVCFVVFVLVDLGLFKLARGGKIFHPVIGRSGKGSDIPVGGVFIGPPFWHSVFYGFFAYDAVLIFAGGVYGISFFVRDAQVGFFQLALLVIMGA